MFRDKNISLKAKGLLGLILSLPENWNFTIQGITTQISEGRTAIQAAISELIIYGYCERERLTNDKKQFVGWGYVFHESPILDTVKTKEPIQTKPKTGKPKAENPTTENPLSGSPLSENPTTENRPQINTEERSKEEKNKDLENKDCVPDFEKMENSGLKTSEAQKEKSSAKKEKGNPDAESCYPFEEFWADYGKKVDRKDAVRLYASVSEADRAAIKAHVPRYRTAQPEVGYRRDPARYLRSRYWESDLTAKPVPTSTGTPAPTGGHLPTFTGDNYEALMAAYSTIPTSNTHAQQHLDPNDFSEF